MQIQIAERQFFVPVFARDKVPAIAEEMKAVAPNATAHNSKEKRLRVCHKKEGPSHLARQPLLCW